MGRAVRRHVRRCLRLPPILRSAAISTTATSSFLWWDIPDRGRELRMHRRVNGSVPDTGTRRILTEKTVTLPVLRWPDRPGRESTAAVRTNVLQDAFDAGRAERTFIGADSGFERIRWQFPVAVFAGRAQFEHRLPPPASACGQVRMRAVLPWHVSSNPDSRSGRGQHLDTCDRGCRSSSRQGSLQPCSLLR